MGKKIIVEVYKHFFFPKYTIFLQERFLELNIMEHYIFELGSSFFLLRCFTSEKDTLLGITVHM